jgi:hypothetical protein
MRMLRAKTSVSRGGVVSKGITWTEKNQNGKTKTGKATNGEVVNRNATDPVVYFALD